MPSDNFADLFAQSDTLSKLDPDAQNRIIDRVTAASQRSDMTDGDKRYFRNLSANTKMALYEQRSQEQPYEVPMIMPMGMDPSTAFPVQDKYQAEIALERAKNVALAGVDYGTAVKGMFQRAPAVVAKLGVDLADVAVSLPSFFSLDGNKYYREEFGEALTDEEYKNRRFVEPYREQTTKPFYNWYDNLETVKNDPAFARTVDSMAMDSSIGALFGAFRVAKAGATLATRVAEIGGSALSNAVGGQLVLAGLDNVEPMIEGANLTESQKNGVRVLSVLGMSLFTSAGVESKIEDLVSRAVEKPTLLEAVGNTAKAVPGGAADASKIAASVLEHPELSVETKNLFTEAAKELGVQLDPAVIEQTLPQALSTLQNAEKSFQKINSGVALEPAEAAALQATPWAAPVPPKRRLTLSSAEASQAASGSLPFSATATTDRALSTVEEIVGKARGLQKSDPAALETYLSGERNRLYDAQRAIFNIYGDKKSYLSHISSQLRKSENELKRVAASGKKLEEGASKEELRNAYRATKQNVDNLKQLKSFVSKEFRADLTAPIPSTPKAAVSESPGIPVAKRGEKKSQESIVSELSKLTPEMQKKVNGISEATKSVMEAQGLKVTDEHLLDIAEGAAKKLQAQSEAILKRPVVVTQDSMPFIDKEVMAERYPSLKILTDALPQASASTMAPQELMQVMQTLIGRSGLAIDDAGYAAQRTVMREAFSLWDEVKASIPKDVPDTPLQKFLTNNGAQYGISKKRASEFATRLKEVFPDMDYISVAGDRNLPNSIGGTIDTLQRAISVGVTKDDFSALLHELGHYNFYYGLDAADKISWLDGMRKYAADTESWGKNFPGYDKRIAGLQTLQNREEIATQLHWAHHPGEMYAEQFRSYLVDSILPPVNSGGAITKTKQVLQRIFDIDSSEFSKLPPDTQELILRTKMMPDPATMQPVSSDLVDRALTQSWHYSDAPTAELRVEELDARLEERYSQRTVGLNVLEEGAPSGMTGVEITPFRELNPIDRVMMYSSNVVNALEDLPAVVEAQALKILHELPGASMEELQLASRRLQDFLKPEARSELIETLVRTRTPAAGKFDPEFDPAAGQSYSAADRASMALDAEAQNFNSLPKHLRDTIDSTESARGRVFYATRRTIYEDELTQLENALNRPLTAPERGRLLKRIEAGEYDIHPETLGADDAAGVEMQTRNLAMHPELMQARNTMTDLAEGWNGQRSAVLHQLAALDVEASSLTEFANNVMTKKGLIETINPAFIKEMDTVENFLRAAKGDDTMVDFFTKGAWRTAFVALCGVGQDEDGYYWSPDKLVERGPFMALMIPGGPTALKFMAKGLIKGSSALSKKLPPAINSNIQKTLRGVVGNFGPTEGLGEELIGARQSALHKVTAKTSELKTFADTIYENFSPQQRAHIARIASGDTGWEKALSRAIDKDPALAITAKVTQKMYAGVLDEMNSLGMIDPSKTLLETNYLNRVYAGAMYKPAGRESIIWSYRKLKGIAGHYFKRRGISELLSDAPRKSAKDSGWTGPQGFTALTKQLEAEGFPSSTWTQGMQFNSYLTPDGTRMFAKTDTLYDKTLASQLEAEHVWGGPGKRGYILDTWKDRSMSMRRDFTKAERTAMGECTDVSVRMAAFAEKIKNDLTQGYVFKHLSGTSYAFNPATTKFTKLHGVEGMVGVEAAEDYAKLNGWTKLPYEVNASTGVLRYGALSGSYVHPDAVSMLKAMQPSQIAMILKNPEAFNSVAVNALGAYSKLLSLFKISKTALSPTTHVANFLSNPFMGYMLGRNPARELSYGMRLMKIRGLELKARELSKTAKTAEDYAAITKMREQMQTADPEAYAAFDKIRKYGIGDSTLLASDVHWQDMIESLDTFSKNRGRDLNNLSPQELMKWNMTSMLSSTLEKSSAALSKGAKKMGQYYEEGDLIFKMGGIMDDMAKGVPIEKAVNNVYEAYFDYSQLAPGIRFLRDTGIAPFVSYTYKAIPALAKAAYKNPHRVAQIGLMYEAIHLMSLADLYGSDNMFAASEALEEIEPDQIAGRQMGGLVRTNFVVPWGGGKATTKDGQVVDTVRFMNTTRQFPGGDIFGTGLSFSDMSGRGMATAVGKLFLQNPIVSTAMDIASGRNIALDIPMYKGGDLDAPEVETRKNEAALDKIMSTFTPNMPGNPWAKTHKDVMGFLVSIGALDSHNDRTAYDAKGLRIPASTAAANMLGFRTRDVVPTMDAATKIKYDQSQLNAEKAYLKRILRDQGVTDEAKEKALQSFVDTSEHVSTKQQRRAELLRRLNQARQARAGGQALVQ